MWPQGKCFLCDSTCTTTHPINEDIDFYNCPNCGEFGVTRQASFNLTENKYRFSSIIKERHLKGLGKLIINTSLDGNIDGIQRLKIESIAHEFPRTASEIIDRVLLNLGNSVEHPSDKIKIDEYSRALLFSRNTSDIHYFLQQLSDLDYIPRVGSIPTEIAIQAKGWDRIAKLNSTVGILNQVFVAMWFDHSTDIFYDNGIKPAVEHDGITRCMRIDKSEHNNKICDQIIAEIRKCKYLIADFTGNRGGVYYEAGYAMGLGKPVIWTVQNDHLKDVHFDTRQYNHICYQDETDLFEKLKNRIEATIPNS